MISLATISLEPGEDGKPKPCVRDVDALYVNGVFYIITFATTNKVKQIEANDEKDENCCIVAIYMKKGTLRINHGEAFYHFDFANKTAT